MKQIKEFDYRLEEKNNIIKDFKDFIKWLCLKKAKTEKNRLKFFNKLELLKKRVNKENEWLDKKIMYKLDSDESSM